MTNRKHLTADAIRALLTESTPGPLQVLAQQPEVQVQNSVGQCLATVETWGVGRGIFDADLFAAAPDLARTALDALAEVERLRVSVATLTAERDRLQRACNEGLPREVIQCPDCEKPHIEGPRHDDPSIDGRTRPHHTHRCYHCGHIWDSGRWSFGVAPGHENELGWLLVATDGRATAPTDSELHAHDAFGGGWLVLFDDGKMDTATSVERAAMIRDQGGAARRWWALNKQRRVCVWPRVVPG